MPRYVRARAVWHLEPENDWAPADGRPSIDVYPSQAIDTGLLFPDGERVMRVPDAIGFLPLGERG